MKLLKHRIIYLVKGFLIVMSISTNLFAQTTIVLHPGPTNHQTATLWNLGATSNYPSDDNYIAAYWTYSSTWGLLRGIMQFDLSSIPSNATITNANLSLYWNPIQGDNGQAGNNASYLQRITSFWYQDSVTWNTQPATTLQNEVSLPMSDSINQNYPNIDVTNLVIDMFNNPDSSFGFLLILQDETQQYSSMKFCSSNYVDSTLWPTLTITYTVPVSQTCITIQPISDGAKDAMVRSDSANANYGDFVDFMAANWQNAQFNGVVRSYLAFDLSAIPQFATIDSAFMWLWYDSISINPGQFSTGPGSNASLLCRITSPWTEDSITWNNQPQITMTNDVLLQQSASWNENYLHIDVTQLVTDMVNNPNSSFGFCMKLNNETVTDNSMKFFSSNGRLPSMLPKLEICYSLIATNVPILTQPFSFNIFPSPATTLLNVEFKEALPVNSMLEIVDITGRLLDSKVIPSGTMMDKINVSALAKGVYFIQIINAQTSEVRRFVKE